MLMGRGPTKLMPPRRMLTSCGRAIKPRVAQQANETHGSAGSSGEVPHAIVR